MLGEESGTKSKVRSAQGDGEVDIAFEHLCLSNGLDDGLKVLRIQREGPTNSM